MQKADNAALKAWIRRRREATGYSRERLGAEGALDVHRNTIERWEHPDGAIPSGEQLATLAALIGSDDDPMPIPISVVLESRLDAIERRLAALEEIPTGQIGGRRVAVRPEPKDPDDPEPGEEGQDATDEDHHGPRRAR